MLLLILGLFFHFHIINCDEIEKANFSKPLRTEHESARSHNFMDSITDVMWNSTPGINQTTRISPRYSFLSTPISHETYLQNLTGQALRGPSFTERFPQANRRNGKITQRKISNRQLKNYSFIDQPRHQLHQGTTVLEISQTGNPESEAKASSYDLVRRSREPALNRIKRSQTLLTPTKKRLYPNLLLSDGIATKGDDTNTDDDDEFEKAIPQKKGVKRMMRMRETSKKLRLMDQTETPTATQSIQTTSSQHQFTQFLRRPRLPWPGVVTRLPTPGASPAAARTGPSGAAVSLLSDENTVTHPYFKMIEELREGYMMVFLIELSRLIASKESQAVHDVVKHTGQIVQSLYQSKQLLWLGQPLINVTRKFARLLEELEIDVIRGRADNVYVSLSQRHEELSVEVNTILEYADMLYDDNEGRHLFDALHEFAVYPNVTLNGYWLCSSLIRNFLRPYRRLKNTQERQELVDSVNLVLESHKTTSPQTPLRSGDVRHEDENQPSPQTEPVTETEPHSDTTWSPRERKRKRHHRPHKRKRERKRHRRHRHRPKYSQRYYQEHNLGSVTARTRVQSRFRVKMQKT